MAKKNQNNAIEFIGFNCNLQFLQYGNGRTAIQLVDKEDGAPVCVATVNIPEAKLEEGEVIIKDYSENKGILSVLVRAGIIEPSHRTIPTGFVEADVCKLKVNPDEYQA